MKSFRTALLSVSAALAAGTASAYTSVNVPGTLFQGGDWDAGDAAQRLCAMPGNPHVWTNILATKAAEGMFKFAANGSWDDNWGGTDISVTNLPATDAGPLSRGGDNISVSGLAAGASVAVAFNDQTGRFSLFGEDAIPGAPVSVQLVGEFNSWGDDAIGFLSDNGDGTWSVEGLDLDPLESGYVLRIATATATNDFGQPLSGSSFAVSTNATATATVFGTLPFGLVGDRGGEFTVAYSPATRQLSFSQTTVASGDATLLLSGNFTGSAPVNMIEVASKRWRSEHFITNAATAPVSFTLSRVDAAGTVEKAWSAATLVTNNMQGNNTTISGTLLATNAAAAIPVCARAPAGRYLLYFNERTGVYTFSRRYTAANAELGNPGMESVSTDATTQISTLDDWGTWSGNANAIPVSSSDGYPVHTGTKAALLRRLYADWETYTGLSQDIGVTQYAANGLSLAVSGYFRQQGPISFSTAGVLVEMRDSSGATVATAEASASELSTTSWTYLSCVAAVPSNAVTAHISYRLNNVSSYGGGGVLVDDPEAKIAGTQTQNFNAWGNLSSFGLRNLDWYASSAKTTNNVSTEVSMYGDLIISEVVEGRDNNKAVELYNGTAATVNLNGYTLVQYDNGATQPTATIALSGTIPSKEAFVISRPANHDPVTCSPAITALADFTSDKLTFNGDDVLELRKGTKVVDVFGTVSAGASGSYWAAKARDATATRNTSVTNASAAFDLAEWTFSATDDVSGLGRHSFDGDQAPSAFVPSGYSCILNTNAFLKTSELANGAGSASFYALCEPPGQSVDVIVQVSSSYEADLTPATASLWRSVATNTIQSGTSWQFFASDISSSSALFVRFLSANGSSPQARARLDDIALDDYSAARRYQYFTDWNYPAPGTYAKAGWVLANGSVSVTGGEGGSRCALLSDGTSSLTSPFFEGGVGDTAFLARVDPDYGEATVVLKLLMSSDKGETWEDTGSRATVGTAATNLTLFAYCSSNSAVRIAYEDEGSDVPVLVDSVYVPAGVLRPSQDFEDWTTANYGNYAHQGWQMTDSFVNNTNGVGESHCGSMVDTMSKHATIRSSYLPEVVGGRCSVRRGGGSTANPVILVQASANGTDWTTLQTVTVSNREYETVFFQVPTNAGPYHFVRFYHDKGATRTDFDDIYLYQPSDTASVALSVSLYPAYLTEQTEAMVTGTAVPENSAEILLVEGLYAVDGGSVQTLGMTNTSYGAWSSLGTVGPYATGTKLAYALRVTFAGLDADGSGGYSTNTVTSAWKTNTVSTVAEGSVWINEINAVSVTDGEYEDEYDFDWDTGEFVGGEMHEYVEICGVTNVDLSGWTIELRAGRNSDIIKLGGDPTYARYTIPDGTVLGVSGNTIPTADGSHGLLVLGDRQLLETKHGITVAVDLSTLVPAAINPDADTTDDNLFAMAAGVVALLDAGGNTVDAVAYNGYDSTGVAPATSSQSNLGETEGLSLGGTGTLAGDFAWDKTGFTPGAQNGGQTLQRISSDLRTANFWHAPALVVTPKNTLYDPFTMRSPLPASMTGAIDVAFGWDTRDVSLNNATMTLFYRSTNAVQHASAGWSQVPMSLLGGLNDTNGYQYYAGTIPEYAYPRCSEIEYYILVKPLTAGFDASWLGADATGKASTNYTATTVQDHPFRFNLAFDDQVYLGLPVQDAYGNVVFEIGNNDTVYPITNFRVRSAPSILTPPGEWATNEIAAFSLDTAEGTGHFEVVPDPALAGGNAFYRLDLLWP